MRLVILLFCALATALPVQAQDDFYVDLSALDVLDGGFDTGEAELLFPPVVAVENKVKEVKTVPELKVKPQAEQPESVANPQEKSATEPSVAENAKDKAVAPKVVSEPIADAAKETSEPQLKVPEETENVALPDAFVAAPQPVAEPQPLPMPADAVSVEPLISPETEAKEDVTGVFAFGEGLYDVTSVMKLQLDELVKKFDNPVANKILIVAYNYDKDGGFMSKHIALKRSTGIRSYLLNKGYKNFSIKIINTDNPQQKNLTEVSEIK